MLCVLCVSEQETRNPKIPIYVVLTGQTYDDLIDHDALLQMKLANNKSTAAVPDDNTVVTITQYTYATTNPTQSAGESKGYTLDAKLELGRAENSTNTLQISSTGDITIQVIYRKNNSMQAAVVIPADKLGTKYFVPPVPEIKGTTSPPDMVTTDVIERTPFKLVIVNMDQNNKIIVEGAETQTFSLQPYQVSQIWIYQEDLWRTMKAENPVAVLFGHPCAMRQNCQCGQLYASLQPVREAKLNFYIPPAFAKDAEQETFLLLSNNGSKDIKRFDPASPVVQTSGTVILYRPGLLLTLIPESDFASCSVILSIPDADNFAVIVVHKDFKAGVRIGNLPLQSPAWVNLNGTDYVSTVSVLAMGKNVIWHSSSTMAVYFMGKKGGAMFGNPAPIISKNPVSSDFRGCVVTPEVLMIGEVAAGWRESLEYCSQKNLELISLPDAKLQKHIYDKILKAKNDTLQEVWIGMRRSSLNGEWYWLNKQPVNHTNWAANEPGAVRDGQCAIMSVESFSWSDESCSALF
ncbi:hypothetical protein L3Q82_002258 [Scortum barcoo]|uniref:Uncharacterized protein n=1 Tax=Scortum barcoo TaxID=214431 RepID=A0ACB8VY63_9TELE|nr:hypothetical protein L3Q82_002258 [Scortum barcoo]